MAKEVAKGNGADGKPAFVLSPSKRTFYEQSHNQHRVILPVGTTTLTIEGKEFLSACTDRVSGGDLLHVFSEDWCTYWQALAVGGGGAEAGVIERSSVRAVVLPGYPITLPAIDAGSSADLPAGYLIRFDIATRRHVAVWQGPAGDTPLDSFGVPNREEARRQCLHHAKQAASVR